ncbi:uncharacterized protein RAG0_05073 [Rhynchosporium agropyri]|uniref:Uncharacterized protein n=1 Tax=Rhynchosporium agropyri TaxID=914238 RepID=A0A1E1KBM6_9HELO|nr:uncharacterized protein RAG0_05073 [Rhynchosporium agropyri]
MAGLWTISEVIYKGGIMLFAMIRSISSWKSRPYWLGKASAHNMISTTEYEQLRRRGSEPVTGCVLNEWGMPDKASRSEVNTIRPPAKMGGPVVKLKNGKNRLYKWRSHNQLTFADLLSRPIKRSTSTAGSSRRTRSSKLRR